MCFKIDLFITARAGMPMSCFVLGIILGNAVSVTELGNSFRLCVVTYGASVGLYTLCGFCRRCGYHSAVIAMRSNVCFTTAHGANVIVIFVIITFPVCSGSVDSITVFLIIFGNGTICVSAVMPMMCSLLS